MFFFWGGGCLLAVQEPELPGTGLELRTKREDGEAETGPGLPLWRQG
jgi:hypothetical protein